MAGASLALEMKPPARLSADTPLEIEAVQIEIYRQMPTWRKIELVEDANRTARQLALAGLRSRHPGESLSRLRRRLLDLVLGEEIALQVYGPATEQDP